MSEYVLEMTGVSKSFPGVKALDNVQLRLRPGKVHALMGENGAGKSTLMKCMFGIYKMDEGQILMDGEPVTISDPMDALKKGIAMVHQELQPIPARTVGENIFLGRYPMKKVLGFIPMVDHAKMYADTEELLKKVRMHFDPKQKVGELSVPGRAHLLPDSQRGGGPVPDYRGPEGGKRRYRIYLPQDG